MGFDLSAVGLIVLLFQFVFALYFCFWRSFGSGLCLLYCVRCVWFCGFVLFLGCLGAILVLCCVVFSLFDVLPLLFWVSSFFSFGEVRRSSVDLFAFGVLLYYALCEIHY